VEKRRIRIKLGKHLWHLILSVLCVGNRRLSWKSMCGNIREKRVMKKCVIFQWKMVEELQLVVCVFILLGDMGSKIV
jgi:hypothetical protein